MPCPQFTGVHAHRVFCLAHFIHTKRKLGSRSHAFPSFKALKFHCSGRCGFHVCAGLLQVDLITLAFSSRRVVLCSNHHSFLTCCLRLQPASQCRISAFSNRPNTYNAKDGGKLKFYSARSDRSTIISLSRRLGNSIPRPWHTLGSIISYSPPAEIYTGR